jgi:hypothetical protein
MYFAKFLALEETSRGVPVLQKELSIEKTEQILENRFVNYGAIYTENFFGKKHSLN